MDNIDIIYAVLGTLIVALSGILVSRRLSRNQKTPKEDPWAGLGRGTNANDYFYTED